MKTMVVDPVESKDHTALSKKIKSVEKLTFFMLFMIMEKIEKILDIDYESAKSIKNFLDEYVYDESDNIGKKCELVSLNEQYKNPEDYLNDIDKTSFSFFKGGVLLDPLKDVITKLKETFNIKKLWVMSYPPKERLDFHIDPNQNRHIVTFNNDDSFFSYEHFSNKQSENVIVYNDKLIEFKNDIDSFNKFFIEENSNNKISSLEPLSVYTFGNTLHTFYNGSNKLRINLVFEIVE